LATTDLVHEAYLKLVDQRLMQWKDRNHFYSIAACAMRQLLVDYTRRNMAGKRDGIVEPVNENHAAVTASHQFWLLALDQALKELETFDDSLPRVVECLLFAGLTQEETARVLGVS